MIWIDSERCTGSGACVAACQFGALRILDDVAQVDLERCAECQACLEVCPERAILWISEPNDQGREIAPRPERMPQAQGPAKRSAVRLASRALPWVGTALATVGRYVAPRMLDALLEALDRRDMATGPAAPRGASTNPDRTGSDLVRSGRQRRHRHGKG